MSHERYSDEQLEAAIDRLDDQIYRLRPGSQFSPERRAKIARLSEQLDALIDERDRREGAEENPAGEKIHKKFPKGTELAPNRGLSIWGGKMALVTAPYRDTTSDEFDPENIALRYTIFLSDMPADPRLVGLTPQVRDGSVSYFDQPFWVTPSRGYGLGYGRIQGDFVERFDYWLEVKFKDLGTHQTNLVQRTLEGKGYRETSWRYPLSMKRWKELLGMSFDEIQDGDDWEAANAVEDTASVGWDGIPGIYALTKKGTLKFIISRKPSKRGL